jgi:hypothetical protein
MAKMRKFHSGHRNWAVGKTTRVMLRFVPQGSHQGLSLGTDALLIKIDEMVVVIAS